MLEKEIVEKIESVEVFDSESLKTCFSVIDKAYEEKIALGQLRAYLEQYSE